MHMCSDSIRSSQVRQHGNKLVLLSSCKMRLFFFENIIECVNATQSDVGRSNCSDCNDRERENADDFD